MDASGNIYCVRCNSIYLIKNKKKKKTHQVKKENIFLALSNDSGIKMSKKYKQLQRHIIHTLEEL